MFILKEPLTNMKTPVTATAKPESWIWVWIHEIELPKRKLPTCKAVFPCKWNLQKFCAHCSVYWIFQWCEGMSVCTEVLRSSKNLPSETPRTHQDRTTTLTMTVFKPRWSVGLFNGRLKKQAKGKGSQIAKWCHLDGTEIADQPLPLLIQTFSTAEQIQQPQKCAGSHLS